MALTEEEILDIYREYDAVWFFDNSGDPRRPHAKLTTDLCSNGYVNSALVMSEPKNCQILARELVARIEPRIGFPPVGWVIGSAYDAITFSYELARKLDSRHAFTKKDPTDSKKMLWRQFHIPAGSLVLQCEELIATLHTTLEVRRAVSEENPDPISFMPFVATAIFRPPRLDARRPFEIIALVRREVKVWEQNECPLCKQGSPRLRPKTHWRELIGRR